MVITLTTQVSVKHLDRYSIIIGGGLLDMINFSRIYRFLRKVNICFRARVL